MIVLVVWFRIMVMSAAVGNQSMEMTPIACHYCDLVQNLPDLSHRAKAHCLRCGALLVRAKVNTINRTLAWTIASLVLYFVAVSFPFLTMTISGIERQTALLTGIIEIYRQGLAWVAILVLVTCVVVPFMQMLGLLYVFLPLKFGQPLAWSKYVFRLFQHMQPWSMMEVFMLSILVALVKLSGMATIVPGLAVFAFALLIFSLAFAVTSVDPHLVWARLDQDR